MLAWHQIERRLIFAESARRPSKAKDGKIAFEKWAQPQNVCPSNKSMRPSILVSNDDGVLSPGIRVLAERLKKFASVTVIAPTQERSTTGHSLTLHKPIRVEKIRPGYYAINGTPADCAYLSIKKLLRKKQDLVVSGINRGAN